MAKKKSLMTYLSVGAIVGFVGHILFTNYASVEMQNSVNSFLVNFAPTSQVWVQFALPISFAAAGAILGIIMAMKK